MPYPPPTGTVDLSLAGSYTPPTGTVDLSLGADSGDQNSATLAGETLSPIGTLTALAPGMGTAAGETLPPTGQGTLAWISPGVNLSLTGHYTPPTGTILLSLGAEGTDRTATLAGETLPPTGQMRLRWTLPGVNLSLTGSYTPPTGTVDLSLGADSGDQNSATLAGETLPPIGTLVALVPILGDASGETLPPLGAIDARTLHRFALAGETLAPTGQVSAVYDPNLLSAVHAVTRTDWQKGQGQQRGLAVRYQPAAARLSGRVDHWQAAAFGAGRARADWQPALSQIGRTRAGWRAAPRAATAKTSRWQMAARLDARGRADWQAANALRQATTPRWQNPPLIVVARGGRWQEGRTTSQHYAERFQDGRRMDPAFRADWQQAGDPGNAPQPAKDAPPAPYRPPWGTRLRLICPLPGTTLRLGRTPCILIAEREIPIRRTYMSTNSASLVRWPDLTPLPVTALTVETDFDSWCWALSATLAGPEAWALVQPNPLACEVLATINGQAWKFLLDVPSTQRQFNSDRVSLKGRSRSAWLHDPYTPSRDFSEANAREMQQLGEAALDNTGWTLDWQLENWVVPAGRYVSHNTPIGVLIRLVTTTDDGLYSDPTLQVITAQKRWPVASWLLDAETVDLLIPESAVISLTQSPVYSQPYNGVYVSGTSHGALALVKIAGTDGALQPVEPLVNELLCDESGVAARQRGLNALSDSGAGWEMDAEVLFTPEVGLVKPGLIVSIAGLKGVSRSCRISAQWSGTGLSVRQSVGLERREVET